MILENLITTNPYLVIVLSIWSLIWKGVALWFAARRRQKGWFIALLIINTLGLLEIIYIIIMRRRSGNIVKTTNGTITDHENDRHIV